MTPTTTNLTPEGQRLAEPTRRLYLDLDGVMADFDAHFPATFGLDHRSMADDAMWATINAHPSYFRDMPPCPGAVEFFRSIEHLRPIILTACPKSNYAHVAGQKRAWVREHLSQHVTVLPVLGGRHKPLFMQEPGDVLIDDWQKNIEAWAAAGGVGILHRNFADTTRSLVTLGVGSNTAAALLFTAPEREGAGLRELSDHTRTALRRLASCAESAVGTDAGCVAEWLETDAENARQHDPDVGIFGNEDMAALFEALSSLVEDIGPMGTTIGRELRALAALTPPADPKTGIKVERIGKDRQGVSVIFARSEYDSEAHRVEEPMNGLVVVLDVDGTILSLDIEDLTADMTAPVEDPAAPKTPDDGVGEDESLECTAERVHRLKVEWSNHHCLSEGDHAWLLTMASRAIRAEAALPKGSPLALAQPAPVGEDETGVRALVDALGDFVGSRVTIRDVLTRDAMRTVPSSRACKAVDAYIASLAPQPPKAETPAGVGELSVADVTRAIENYGGIENGAFTERGREILFKAFIDVRASGARSTAPAARPGDEVEIPQKIRDRHTDLVVTNRAYENGTGSWSDYAKARTLFECDCCTWVEGRLAAAPAADGGRA